MRILSETDFLEVWTQTLLGGVRGGRVLVTEFRRTLYVVQIIPQHGTLYASQVDLTLFLYSPLWGCHYRQTDSSRVLICPQQRTDASPNVPCSCSIFSISLFLPYYSSLALHVSIFPQQFAQIFALPTLCSLHSCMLVCTFICYLMMHQFCPGADHRGGAQRYGPP